MGAFFDLVKQIQTPLTNRLARLRLSPLGSAQSHLVSRFDELNVENTDEFVNEFSAREELIRQSSTFSQESALKRKKAPWTPFSIR